MASRKHGRSRSEMTGRGGFTRATKFIERAFSRNIIVPAWVAINAASLADAAERDVRFLK